MFYIQITTAHRYLIWTPRFTELNIEVGDWLIFPDLDRPMIPDIFWLAYIDHKLTIIKKIK